MDKEARKAAFHKFARQIGMMDEGQRATLAASLPAITTIEGRTLSVHNQCLLASQCPTATIVGGFRQWLKAGRVVRKGEHGHNLWVPCMRSANDNADQDQKPGFIIGTVFDVSQTAETGTAQAETQAEVRAEVAAPLPHPASIPQSEYYSTEFRAVA